MVDAHIITINTEDSRARSQVCMDSMEKHCSGLSPWIFPATEPNTIYKDTMETFGELVQWTWPQSHFGEGIDMQTGLYKRMYQAIDQKRVEACALSHFRLWKLCADEGKTIVVLEHDARFIRDFDSSDLDDNSWGAVGLNDPRGNTRKGQLFHAKVAACGDGINRVPIIDEPTEPPLPMGIAGNSAYIIKPAFAKKLLDEVRRIGMWPNDAIMCRQLFPELKVVYPYYTDVQKGESTTTSI
jgi:GR25 family glycosyltransferase involved in LPS biosynthesis